MGRYRWLKIGAAASALGVGMFVLSWLAGSFTLFETETFGEFVAGEAEYNTIAIALIVLGAMVAIASLLAHRREPNRPRWVGTLAASLIVIAVIALIIAALVIAFMNAFCAEGCN